MDGAHAMLFAMTLPLEHIATKVLSEVDFDVPIDDCYLEDYRVGAAKGITSGYVPLSACLVSEKVWRVIKQGATATGRSGTATRTQPIL